MTRIPLRTRASLIAIPAAACLMAGVAACGSSSSAGTTNTTRAAAAAETCPNRSSTATYVTVRNTVAEAATLDTSGWSCADGNWSETGNPGKFNGRALPASGTVARVRLEKVAGAAAAWQMRVTYPSGTGGTFRLHFQENYTGGGNVHTTETELGVGPGSTIVNSATVGTVKVGGATKDLVATTSRASDTDFTVTLSAR